MNLVPVVAEDGTPLDACHPARARELIKLGRAVRRSAETGFYIQLRSRPLKTVPPTGGENV
jgi:hypothetical protein